MGNRSNIWRIDLQILKQMVKESNSMSDLLRKFNLNHNGGNHRTLKKRLEKEGINFDHIKLGKYTRPKHKKYLLEEILIENSLYKSGHSLKNRLIEAKILINKCYDCGINPFWNGKQLVLQIEHINGNNRDHRKENLKLLCPNCHSQTDTYCGKNRKLTKKCNCGNKISENDNKCYICLNKDRLKVELSDDLFKKITKTDTCVECGNKKIGKKGKHNICINCSHLLSRKVKRPNAEILKKEVEELGYSEVGRKYGVSDNAIRKWLKKYLKENKYL